MTNKVKDNKIKNEVVNENTINVNENEVKEEKTVEPITLDEFKAKVSCKQKTTITDKKKIIQLVIKNCIYEDNGVYYIDYLMREFVINLCMIGYYTDFEMGDLSYDYLADIGVIDYVKDELYESDFNSLKCIIFNELEQKVNNLNSVGAVITRKFNEIIGKIPDVSELKGLIDNLPNILNSLDPSVVNAFANDLHNGKIINKRDNEKIYNFDEIKEIVDKNKQKNETKK
nr:MAG TPA: hypothetical protein [Caudoviricetes sp.]